MTSDVSDHHKDENHQEKDKPGNVIMNTSLEDSLYNIIYYIIIIILIVV